MIVEQLWAWIVAKILYDLVVITSQKILMKLKELKVMVAKYIKTLVLFLIQLQEMLQVPKLWLVHIELILVDFQYQEQ